MRLLPWMSAASSGVPRLDGLARVVRLVVGASVALAGIRLVVVPAGAPISNWNCSSGELVYFFGFGFGLGGLPTSVSALQGLDLIMQLQHYVMIEFGTSIFTFSKPNDDKQN